MFMSSNKKVELFEGAGVSEPVAEDNVQLASTMSNQELVTAGRKTLDETDQVVVQTLEMGTQTAGALKRQTEQMGRIVNELDTIPFSIKKVSHLVKEMGRQVATDKCIMLFLLLIVIGVIAIIFVKDLADETDEGDVEKFTDVVKEYDSITPVVIATTVHPKMTPVMSFSWQSYIDETSSVETCGTFSGRELYEHINVTRDSSDYLWYMTFVNIASNEGFFRTGNSPSNISWPCLACFCQWAASRYCLCITGESEADIQQSSVNKISLLSVSVGLQRVLNLVYEL